MAFDTFATAVAYCCYIISPVQAQTEHDEGASCRAEGHHESHGWPNTRYAIGNAAALKVVESDCYSGLVKIDVGPPLESTAARAKGFDFGLVALLEKADDVKVYAEHPVHQKYVDCRADW